MKSTNESIPNLLSTDNQSLYLDFDSAHIKFQDIFQNSSPHLKLDMKKHLVFESDILRMQNQKLECKVNDKWELYAMLVFQSHLTRNMEAAGVEQCVIERLGVDPQK